MSISTDLKAEAKELSILFAEDHTELRVQTQEILKTLFKVVSTAVDGKDAITQYAEYFEKNNKYFDIVLSDIEMPTINGIVLSELIYQRNENQVILILSAHDETKYLLPLINLGIDKFIKKPLDYQELLKILLDVTQKINKDAIQNSSQDIDLGENVIYSRETQSLQKGKQNIYLTKYEIIFLDLITVNIGKIYSNEEIVAYYNSLNENIDAQNIRKLVSKIRKKLPTDSLESIYGVGYKINR